MWGREWVIGTSKHPALPSWVLEGSRLAAGAVGWPAYLVSQGFVVTALLLVYALGREAMGDVRAAAATLLQFGIYFVAWPTPEFNHNIAQMSVFAGFCWALWRAVEHGGTRRWMLLGLIAGAGLYTKLSVALLLGVGSLWLIADSKGGANPTRIAERYLPGVALRRLPFALPGEPHRPPITIGSGIIPPRTR